MNKFINNIKNIVIQEMSCSAHNIEHVKRVVDLCGILANSEDGADMEILLVSALLHDIARVNEDQDLTGETDHAALGAQKAGDILKDFDYPEYKVKKVQHCIETHRFRSGKKPESIEARILFDADKLDVLGAVGIARTYMMSGQYGQSLDFNSEEYSLKGNSDANGRLKDMSKHSPFVEFECKYKKIPDRLYTEKAKEIARERLAFMDAFFIKLKDELRGKA
jgi:uncharacterized protein